MESDVRETLRRMADEIPRHWEMPSDIPRRARLRVAERIGLISVLIVGLVLSAWAGTRAFQRSLSPVPAREPGSVLVREMAFSSGPLGRRQVFFSDHTGAVRQLTSGPGDHRAVDWDPAGTRLLVISTSPRTPKTELDVVEMDGTALPLVTVPRALVVGASWSPDGSRIVYSTGRDLYLIDARGGSPTQVPLPSGIGEVLSPTWSPTADEIAFLSEGAGGRNRTIAAVRSDGTGLRTIVSGVGGPAAWSPDGRRLAFMSSSVGGVALGWPAVSIVNADGSGLRELFQDAAVDLSAPPSWSSDGTHVVVASRWQDTEQIYAYAVQETQGQPSLTWLSRTGTDEWAPVVRPSPLLPTSEPGS